MCAPARFPRPIRVRWHRRGIDDRRLGTDHQGVEVPEQMPTDPLQLAALVALAVADIQLREDIDTNALIHDFRRTAWPSKRCEQQ